MGPVSLGAVGGEGDGGVRKMGATGAAVGAGAGGGTGGVGAGATGRHTPSEPQMSFGAQGGLQPVMH
jgi:hypothetical protein